MGVLVIRLLPSTCSVEFGIPVRRLSKIEEAAAALAIAVQVGEPGWLDLRRARDLGALILIDDEQVFP